MAIPPTLYRCDVYITKALHRPSLLICNFGIGMAEHGISCCENPYCSLFTMIPRPSDAAIQVHAPTISTSSQRPGFSLPVLNQDPPNRPHLPRILPSSGSSAVATSRRTAGETTPRAAVSPRSSVAVRPLVPLSSRGVLLLECDALACVACAAA